MKALLFIALAWSHGLAEECDSETGSCRAKQDPTVAIPVLDDQEESSMLQTHILQKKARKVSKENSVDENYEEFHTNEDELAEEAEEEEYHEAKVPDAVDLMENAEEVDAKEGKEPIPLFGVNPPSKPNLQACEGECDTDAECAAGLKCFQRKGYTPVPGCTGEGRKNWDYCYDPSGSVELSGDNDNTAKNLTACTGECDNDDQCAVGLKCFQRQKGETIPGCIGTGKGKKWDYCYNPNWQARAPCEKGKYYSESGGECKVCESCPSGQYRRGCNENQGTRTSPGVCTACGSCGGSGYRDGCGNLSAGSCRAWTYVDLGVGKCLHNGKRPAYSFRPFSAGVCEKLCSGLLKCGGYSTSGSKCLLWLAAPLTGEGNMWKWNCIVKAKQST